MEPLTVVAALAALAVVGAFAGGVAWGAVRARRRAQAGDDRALAAVERLAAGDFNDAARRTRAGLAPLDREITRAAEELSRAREDLQLAGAEHEERARQDALRRLGAGVAGRLAEALGGASAALARAERGGPDDRTRALHDVRRAIGKAARLADGLRALGAERDPEVRPQALDELARVAVAASATHAESLGVALVFVPPDRSPEVAIDAGSAVAAIGALIDNAVEAAAHGGRHVAVRVEAGERAARLVVEDDGPGIPPAALAHVFDPLYSTRDGSDGVGMGLPLARAVAERGGGSLAIEERAQGGSAAVLTLPAPPAP